MKKILLTAAAVMFVGVASSYANTSHVPQNKVTGQDIVDAMNGAKGRCPRPDGTTGKWYPTEMTETRSENTSNTRGNSSSYERSVSSSFGASLTGPNGQMTTGETRSISNNRSTTDNQGSGVTYKYECR